MESWTLIPRGVSWSLLGLGSFFMIWWNKNAAGSTGVNACGFEICVKLLRFSIISVLLHKKYSCFFFYSGYFRRFLGLCSPNDLGLLLEMSLPSLRDCGLVTDNSVSHTEKSLKVSYNIVEILRETERKKSSSFEMQLWHFLISDIVQQNRKRRVVL